MILPRIITSVIGRHLVNPATGKVRRVTYHSVRRPGLEPRESDDPVARIRAYTTSGAGPQETAAEAPTPASGTCRRGSAAGGAKPAPAAVVAPASAPAVAPFALPPPAP
jgi:hypothetical protein